jgi:hypothetical protein
MAATAQIRSSPASGRTRFSAGGCDLFILSDNPDDDTIDGGGGDDTLDLSAMTGPVTVTFTGDESGEITDGADTITFSDIEHLILTDQADSVDGGADSLGIDVDARDGDDTITGSGARDSIQGGDGRIRSKAARSVTRFFGGTGADTIDAGSEK